MLNRNDSQKVISSETKRRVFLSAKWHWLLMLNWEIDPALVSPHVPDGTELDFFNDRTYISIVGFLFKDTKVCGIPVPFHRNFEEVNLRFYVRRIVDKEIRRGVSFISELVPKHLIAKVAKWGYNENYSALPMRSKIETAQNSVLSVEYGWKFGGAWNFAKATSNGSSEPLVEGSLEQFIAEHYWGYAAQRNGTTFEYQVIHPSWNVWTADKVEFVCDIERVYGPQFHDVLSAKPDSAFIADGSEITVSFPKRF